MTMGNVQSNGAAPGALKPADWPEEVLQKSELEILIRTAFLVPFEGSPKEGSNNDGVRWGLPLMIWGPPGIGKSKRIKRVAEHLCMHFEKVYAFTLDPTDVSGIPIPDREKYEAHRVTSLPKIKRLMNAMEGVLFWDEFSDAPSAVQSAMQGVILDAEFGEDQLPNRIRQIMAGNPPSCSTTGWRPSPAMANRLCHVVVAPPSVDSWTKYMMGVEYDDLDTIDKGEADIIKWWASTHLETVAIFARFLASMGDSALHSLPGTTSESRWKGWASPRSWEVAARVWTTAKILGTPPRLTKMLIKGCVGPDAETALSSFVAALDLPSPSDVLEGVWTVDPNRLDQAFVAYSSVGSYIKAMDKDTRKLKALKAWQVVQRAEMTGLLDLAYALVDEIGKYIPRSTSQEVSDIAGPIYARFTKEGFLRFTTTGGK